MKQHIFSFLLALVFGAVAALVVSFYFLESIPREKNVNDFVEIMPYPKHQENLSSIYGLDVDFEDVLSTPFKTKKITLTADNTVNFFGIVHDISTYRTYTELVELAAKGKETDPIYLVIYSPGGYIADGLLFIDAVKSLRRPVHTINIFSASMGFQISQELGDRMIPQNGTFMAHRASGMFWGEFPGNAISRLKSSLLSLAKMEARVVSRTGGIHTNKSYYNLIRDEFWCDGITCTKEGLIDYVVDATCDASLSGSQLYRYLTVFFGGMSFYIDVKAPKCMLVPAILDVEIYINGKKWEPRQTGCGGKDKDNDKDNDKDCEKESQLYQRLLNFSGKALDKKVITEETLQNLFR